jgi:hypothetical protein
MLAYLFVILAVGVRFGIATGSHFWHFTPVGASLLFFGAKQPRKFLWIPIVAFALSDLALNRFVYHYPITLETFSSTLWYVLAIGIGSLLKEKQDFLRVAGAALAGSVSFFIISNFAVWAAYNMYPKTLSGLAACYVAAIPFFRSTVASDMIYTLAFFAAPLAIEVMRKQLHRQDNAAAA